MAQFTREQNIERRAAASAFTTRPRPAYRVPADSGSRPRVRSGARPLGGARPSARPRTRRPSRRSGRAPRRAKTAGARRRREIPRAPKGRGGAAGETHPVPQGAAPRRLAAERGRSARRPRRDPSRGVSTRRPTLPVWNIHAAAAASPRFVPRGSGRRRRPFPRGISARQARRRGDSSQRTIHVVAAASPRPAPRGTPAAPRARTRGARETP